MFSCIDYLIPKTIISAILISIGTHYYYKKIYNNNSNNCDLHIPIPEGPIDTDQEDYNNTVLHYDLLDNNDYNSITLNDIIDNLQKYYINPNTILNNLYYSKNSPLIKFLISHSGSIALYNTLRKYNQYEDNILIEYGTCINDITYSSIISIDKLINDLRIYRIYPSILLDNLLSDEGYRGVFIDYMIFIYGYNTIYKALIL